VATLLHRDSLKIARSEGFPEPYGDADIEAARGLYHNMDFQHPQPLGEASLTLAMVCDRAELSYGGDGTRTSLPSNRRNTRRDGIS